MMSRVPVTALVAVLLAVLAVLPAACSWRIPNGACDDYDQGLREDTSSCTADGKLTHTLATSCSDPDGPVYTTTTTACGSGEHCVAEDALRTAACVLTCVTDADCHSETPWCRSGACVPLLGEGSQCSTSSRCASGLACSIAASTNAPANDASEDCDGGDGGDAREEVCADGHPADLDCRCR